MKMEVVTDVTIDPITHELTVTKQTICYCADLGDGSIKFHCKQDSLSPPGQKTVLLIAKRGSVVACIASRVQNDHPRHGGKLRWESDLVSAATAHKHLDSYDEFLHGKMQEASPEPFDFPALADLIRDKMFA